MSASREWHDSTRSTIASVAILWKRSGLVITVPTYACGWFSERLPLHAWIMILKDDRRAAVVDALLTEQTTSSLNCREIFSQWDC